MEREMISQRPGMRVTAARDATASRRTIHGSVSSWHPERRFPSIPLVAGEVIPVRVRSAWIRPIRVIRIPLWMPAMR
jgi:hypothetical protein